MSDVTAKLPSGAETERGLPAIGSVIAGRYRVERVIGSGGMGFVYAARHVQLNELVAVKVLHPKVASDEQAVERFLREARACVKIKNEHVVKVIDVFTGEGGTPPYILMEFLTGQDLGHVVHTQGALPISSAVDYLLQACEAISEAHGYGIVHRDIKPANLLLTQRSDGMPLVKVLDFGISKALVPDDEAKNHNLTETTAVFGSPTYMSPEQVRSAKHVDARADVWSLGIVLFELLTARVPFGGESMSGLLASIVADPPRPLRVYRADAPPGLEAAILGCLEKNRDQRVQSVQELAQLLRPFASPLGLMSADAIARITTASKITPSMRPPMMSSAPMAFSGTERSVVTNAPANKSINKTALAIGIAFAALVVLALAGLAALKITSGRVVAASSAPPATVVAPPSAVVAPQMPATVTSATAQSPSIAPSASPSAVAASNPAPGRSARPKDPRAGASSSSPPASAAPPASAPPTAPSAPPRDVLDGRF